jgi:hypothetical protein
MPAWLTSAIELVVGTACLGAAVVAWGRRELRRFAAIFAIAGVAAVGHAAWALATR